jgi:peptide/nickel transport system substrate-binding protein
MIRTCGLVCCIGILVCIVSCGFSSVREEGAIYIHMGGEPKTLNSIISNDASTTAINKYIEESLIQRNKDTLEFEPLLAESWIIYPDNMRFVFKLKKGIFWHDGVEFTADDLIFSYKIIMKKDTDDAFLKNYYQDINRVTKIDRYTVEFSYKTPYYRAFEMCGSIPILPKHVFEKGKEFNNHKNNRKPIGTGPYIFKEWKTGQKIVLERNEKYWGKKPAIRKIIFKIVHEQKVAFKMLKKEELDMMGLRPIQWTRQTSGSRFNNYFQKIKYDDQNYSYIGWNNARELFRDVRVRKALTMMIDREKISNKLFYGLSKVVSGPFYVNSPDYDVSVKPFAYNVKSALQLLKEAGWDDHDNDGILDKKGKKFVFVFTITSGSSSAERIGTIIKEDLSKIGIEMSIERYEWAVFQEKVFKKRDFDAMFGGWSLDLESDPYQLWHSSNIKSGDNFLSYLNPEIDYLCEKIRKTYNVNERRKLYHRFHRIIHEDQPCTFMFCHPDLVAVSRKFKNVKVHAKGLDLTEWTM